MNILILRNGQQFGPYPAAVAQQYLAQGALLPHDLARIEGSHATVWVALAQLLTQSVPPAPSAPGPTAFTQALKHLKAFDHRLLFPWKAIASGNLLRDRRLLALAAIGLAPLFAVTFAPALWFGYWAIALYFSILWALFFYGLFRTTQVQSQLCVLCFFFTGIVAIAGLLTLQNLFPWSVLYAMSNSKEFFIRGVGMLAGVGVHEELCKAAILFWLVRRPGQVLIPQTVVFYGMISGLGFGIYEGVTYQRSLNRAQVVDVAYFLNIIRLTSLPFLHAIWTGIAGYFISFAALFPAKRHALWIVAILIPAALHGIYDTFAPGLFRLVDGFLGVALLMTYLANCQRMQQHLAAP